MIHLPTHKFFVQHRDSSRYVYPLLGIMAFGIPVSREDTNAFTAVYEKLYPGNTLHVFNLREYNSVALTEMRVAVAVPHSSNMHVLRVHKVTVRDYLTDEQPDKAVKHSELEALHAQLAQRVPQTVPQTAPPWAQSMVETVLLNTPTISTTTRYRE